jgi:hypothetical protein
MKKSPFENVVSTLYTKLLARERKLKEFTEGLRDGLVGNLLLNDHTDGANHGKTAVVEFLRLDAGELGRTFGLEAKGVKSDVAWVVIVIEAGPEGSIGVIDNISNLKTQSK